MIIVSYKVDKNLYYHTDATHHLIMTTTEYIYKNNKLAHLCIGKNFNIRLNNVLQYEFSKSITSEQFFCGKTYNCDKVKPTTRSNFEQKLNQFNLTQTLVTKETVEDYAYTNKKGKRDTVQIVVVENSVGMTATIDFKDAEQFENFICPEWITLD